MLLKMAGVTKNKTSSRTGAPVLAGNVESTLASTRSLSMTLIDGYICTKKGTVTDFSCFDSGVYAWDRWTDGSGVTFLCPKLVVVLSRHMQLQYGCRCSMVATVATVASNRHRASYSYTVPTVYDHRGVSHGSSQQTICCDECAVQTAASVLHKAYSTTSIRLACAFF